MYRYFFLVRDEEGNTHEIMVRADNEQQAVKCLAKFYGEYKEYAFLRRENTW